MADETEEYAVGSPSKFDWLGQSSLRTLSTGTQTTEGADSHHAILLQMVMCMNGITSTMAQMIQTSNEYVDTIAENSNDAIKELRKDVTNLAESIVRLDERLKENEKRKKDTAENEEWFDVAHNILSNANDRLIALSISMAGTEKRLASVEGRVRRIEKLLVQYKRHKVQKGVLCSEATSSERR